MTALLKLPELAKYELLEEVGHGGMATVYRARDRRLGREVAIKLIHRHLRDSSEVAARFAREATAVAKLRHRNIVEVYDVSDPEEPERYLVVELIRGITLRDRLKRDGPLPPEVAAAVVLEIGAGLDHAHRQGVVHRDVKPENVLIELTSATAEAERAPPRIMLTDFGIAKLLDAQGVTSTGQVLGSPAHMAPEQIEGGIVDARTDVFALGVLLYEAVVGRLPFSGDHPAQVLRKVLEGEFVSPERQDARIGGPYSRVIVRAMARSRDQRFESVEAMLEALRRELASLGYSRMPPLLDAVVRADPNFEQDLVSRLVERGSLARSEGHMRAAADDLGRALAYRPGDRQLLRRVSNLERDRKLRRFGRWSAVCAGAAALGAGVYYQLAPPPADPEGPRSVEARPAPAARSVEATGLPAAAATRPQPPQKPSQETVPAASTNDSPGGVTPGAPAVLAPAPTRRRPDMAASRARVRRAAASGSPSAGMRDVVVRITGAMGGTLKIDGEEVEWYGDVRHPLTLGPHRFEFIAPDSTCCESQARIVEVTAGEGPQHVIGEIPFLDATVRVSPAEGESGVLACPTLFSGDQPFPGERRVAMSRVEARGICTVRGHGPGSLPQRTEVTLRAGQTTVIPWP